MMHVRLLDLFWRTFFEVLEWIVRKLWWLLPRALYAPIWLVKRIADSIIASPDEEA